MYSLSNQLNCWVITENKIGMENQAIGLAENLGIQNINIKYVSLNFPWNIFAPYLRYGKTFAIKNIQNYLSFSLPNIIIACGRKAIIPTLMLKEKHSQIKTIYIQDPKISAKYFDCVICPHHDKILGPNIIKMHGSIYRVSKNKIEKGRIDFASNFAFLKGLKLGFLLGGPNGTYIFNLQVAKMMAEKIKLYRDKYNVNVLITPSRRTPKVIIAFLKEKFKKDNRIYIWDELGSNPYYGILAYADCLIVTSDSINMISEACSTDKPVYIYKLPGKDRKFSIFHQYLIKQRRAIFFEEEELSFAKVPPLNEIDIVIAKLRKLLNL